MSWPEAIVLAWIAMEVAWHAAKHGQERDPYHGGYAFVAWCVFAALLWWAGLW